jgi:hypothetical protein
MREMSTVLSAILANIRSSASAHMSGDEVASRASLDGSTPWLVPYCGSSASNEIESSKTTRLVSPSSSTTMAVRLCVLESRPR